MCFDGSVSGQLSLEPVRSLWVGDAIPEAHRACVESFLRVGHPFEMFTYGPVANLPRGVVVRDAEEVVSRDRIFTYGKSAGESAGGLSGFSNLFRYAMLARCGGYWVDCDVFCLRPFPTGAMVISTERMRNGRRAITSCVLKCPARDPFAQYCLARAAASDPKTMVHGATGPALVAEVVRKRGLESAVAEPDAFCPVDWFDEGALLRPGSISGAAHAVHLWGEVWRRIGGVPWPGPRGSIMESLARRNSQDDVSEGAGRPGLGGWWSRLRRPRPAVASTPG